MKKFILGMMVAVSFGTPAFADPKLTKGFNTMDAMGCMLLRECTDGVDKIESIATIVDEYPNTNFDSVADEFNTMLVALEQVGVGVFLADQKYFPKEHRGVYHTVGNNFFLNKNYMDSTNYLMQVMRHEGWHAAQDCMAGTIDNSLIAIIMPEDSVPIIWRVMAERTYPNNVVPWEAEAGWAGRTEHMTMKALQACAAGEMWNVYSPTPLTRKYLIKEGYISK
jgi:hypothetical protein|tara:strand:+ start:614 stop:1282 length:669 start_codon:yes stop_codon:yes gene_type:complete